MLFDLIAFDAEDSLWHNGRGGLSTDEETDKRMEAD